MTGNKFFFSKLKQCSSGHVTFGDGTKGRIITKENITKNNLPCLNDVRYVEGLKVNLISVSQLCEQGYSVNFSKNNCVVIDEKIEFSRMVVHRLITAIIGSLIIQMFVTQLKKIKLGCDTESWDISS